MHAMPKPVRTIGVSRLATVSELQTPQGTQIAVKEFNRQVLSPLQHEQYFSAAERWKLLSSPGLVTYLDVRSAENQIMMTLMDRSAAKRLREGPSDPRVVLHTMRGILAALVHLHAQGQLHVNLKPSNVFFDADGRPRLSDGLLVPEGDPGRLPSPTNHKYLTPERASDGFGPISAASDLYSVGFLALELLAGDRFGRAFQGIGDNASDDDPSWIQWHASSQEAPRANHFSKACPADLAAVIARMVSKRPSARYATAREVLQALPHDIAVQAGMPDSPSATISTKREALSTHVLERPATGIVLAIASGPRAGEMIGTNETELMVGFDHDCFVRFSSKQYPHGGGKVLMRRGSEGWYVVRVSGSATYVNQRQLEEKSTLRSGDIIRLSPRGPDVQFTMQSGGVAIQSLVNRFLPARSGVGTPTSGPLPSASTGAHGIAERPAFSEPSAAGAAVPTTASIGEAASMPGEEPPTQRETKAPRKSLSLFAPRTWDKKQTTLLLTVCGGILILLALFLFSRSAATPLGGERQPSVDNPNALPNDAAGAVDEPGADEEAKSEKAFDEVGNSSEGNSPREGRIRF